MKNKNIYCHFSDRCISNTNSSIFKENFNTFVFYYLFNIFVSYLFQTKNLGNNNIIIKKLCDL